MFVGHITKLCHDKKHGLIRANDGEEIHFHQQCLWDIHFDELTDGQEVEFEIQSSRKGFLGFHIRPHFKN